MELLQILEHILICGILICYLTSLCGEVVKHLVRIKYAIKRYIIFQIKEPPIKKEYEHLLRSTKEVQETSHVFAEGLIHFYAKYKGTEAEKDLKQFIKQAREEHNAK